MTETTSEAMKKAQFLISAESGTPDVAQLQTLSESLLAEKQLLLLVNLLWKNRLTFRVDTALEKTLREAARSVAATIARGELAPPSAGEIKSLVSSLKAGLDFRLARKVLQSVRSAESEDYWVVQQLALCTYKDEDLLAATRFNDAIELLETIGLRNPVPSEVTDESLRIHSETLALGGAVYKRKWEHGGQLEFLHEALALYMAAWDVSLMPGQPDAANERKAPRDDGYAAVNAAFVLDVLASRARTVAARNGTTSSQEKAFAAEAIRLRTDALERLSQALEADPDLVTKRDWIAETIAELHYGLKNYEDASEWLIKARDRFPTGWEAQTTFRQLVSIARHQGCEPPKDDPDHAKWKPEWRALHAFLGEDTHKALMCYRGKVGLALSGGGFRASLFHLGVLARLAEMDVLRSVEVLSTVSGGSIVGAHYYLEIKRLIEENNDEDLTRDSYIEAVKRVMESFLNGVQQNLRMRVLANLFRNLRMVFGKSYTTSHRLGELYEQEIYRHVPDGKGEAKRCMPDLLVHPAENAPDISFNPKFQNWRRRAKVPVLLLNSTSLNTGHSWHFTARWMGEPPGLIGTEVDVNERYRRLWYGQAPTESLKRFRLGYAVAASACVPGLFEPLSLKGLYHGRTVRLVDGGVHDNQGVDGLLNESCNLILCSDATGQMEDLRNPSNSMLGVPLRASSILMDRVREAQYLDLQSRVESRALEGLFFIHMKQGLETQPIDWVDCDDPTRPPASFSCTTGYGIDKDLQRKLAAIRTDLDSFSEVEAYSLMLSGYLMTEHQFQLLDHEHCKDRLPGHWGDFDIDAPRHVWPFLELENIARQPQWSSDARRSELAKQLDVGAALFLKVFKLVPGLRAAGLAVCALVLFGLGYLIYTKWDSAIVLGPWSLGGIVLLLAATVAGALLPLFRWLNPQKAMQGYTTKLIAAIAGWLVANMHLWVFDRIFLRYGRLKRLINRR